MRIDLTLIDVKRVADKLAADFPDDAELLSDMLEGCTDLYECASRLCQRIEDEDTAIAGLKDQMDSRKARSDRAKLRKDGLRDALIDLMQASRQSKIVLPEATISIRRIAPKLIVTDADKVPDDYCTFTRKPRLADIRDASEPVAGTSMDNGGTSLTVRRK